MRRIAIGMMTSAACLTALAADAKATTQVAGWETYAVVAPMRDVAMARPFAERHCAAYGRFAHWRWTEGNKVVFDCVLQPREIRSSGPTGGVF